MRFLPYGDAGLLVETGPDLDPLSIRALALGLPGVLDAVPAARTVLIEFDPARTSPEQLREPLRHPTTRPTPLSPATEVHIAVRYDGPDLDAVAAELDRSVAEVVARHCAATYTVAFCGFAPGFAYLSGLDPLLHVPRLSSPRTSVPAGSVGIAGQYTGVYPRSSPGGWRLLGTTPARLWDATREPPALLQPGTLVRFEPVD